MSRAPTTNVALIQSLANQDEQLAWEEFVNSYEPLIYGVAKGLGLNDIDAADAVQEVLVHVSQVVANWSPNGNKGAFRSWLRRVARNRILKVLSRTRMLKSEAASSESRLDLSSVRNEPRSTIGIAFRRQVLIHVVDRVKGCFSESTWQAFWQSYVDGTATATVAENLGMSVGAVYIARSRVLNRIQAEVQQLVDQDFPEFGEGFVGDTAQFKVALEQKNSRDEGKTNDQ
ncbi:MAG: sigma-70 family RNA polymerase sigma factor [Planctomycetota bacterium]